MTTVKDFTDEELIEELVYTVESVSHISESNYYNELREEIRLRMSKTTYPYLGDICQ